MKSFIAFIMLLCVLSACTDHKPTTNTNPDAHIAKQPVVANETDSISIGSVSLFKEADLNLSPVNCGDCVADRIMAERTEYVKELERRYCYENNSDETKAKQCIENGNGTPEFAFFTDRCSETDFFIGINGKEVQLKRTSENPGKPHYFNGSYAGNGIKVTVRNRGANKTEVIVSSAKLTKTFKDVIILSEGPLE